MSVLVQRLGLSSTGDRNKWTFSAWIKRSRSVSSGSEFFFSSNNERTSGANYSSIMFQNDHLHYYDYYNSSSQVVLRTNRVFRDFTGWYHIVVRYDSTLATADDRIRFYVNGTQETSMALRTNVNQNDASFVNTSGYDNFIGTQTNNLSGHFLGGMSHVHLCDGYSYDASSFGSTDATTGEWSINTNPSVSYGTNGFFILKDGNSLTDQSPNSNNFSVGSGTLTPTEDNPSNVFSTFNYLGTYKDNFNPGNWLQKGNTKINTDGRTDYRWFTDFGTIGATSGKYYMELKINQIGSATNVDYGSIGIANDFAMSDAPQGTYGREANDWGSGVYSYAFRFDSRYAPSIALIKRENGTSTKTDSYQTQSSNLQVIMMAWDLDNGKIWFGRENSWFNSGNPGSGTNAALTFTPNGRTFLPYVNHWVHNSGNNPIYSVNFGNGYFDTTAVSAGTNASNNGIFEYNVPTGFTALSTKGLNL